MVFLFVHFNLHDFNQFHFNLQGWPTAELSPVQALLVMITYEERMGETIDQKDVETGKVKLNEILT